VSDETLFAVQGDTFIPTALAGSPWHPAMLHGGAPAGLLAYCLEREARLEGWQPAKLAIDLLRPVPKAPLGVSVSTRRKGNRIVHLEASLFSHDTVIAVANCLFIKPQELSLPAFAPRSNIEITPPDDLEAVSFRDILFGSGGSMPPGLHTTIQLRPVTALCGQGRGTAWIVLPVAIIEGQSNSPFMLAALASDFGNGVGQLRLGGNLGTINADIVLQLSRLPEGEWVGIDSTALLDATGVGQVLTTLYDTRGRIGQVSQTIMPMGEPGV